MIEMVPNWHPVFTHFTIALLLTASALFLTGGLLRRRGAGARATTAARWNLALGAAFAAATVATGYQAYLTVSHDAPAHAAMTLHLKWALASAGLFAVATLLAWLDRRRPAGSGWMLGALLAAGSVALAVTGYLGGENVYRHGIGVMRLPEAAAPAHEHAHGHDDHGHSEVDE